MEFPLYRCTAALAFITWWLLTLIVYDIRGQLIINVKNLGGDILQETIIANTTTDTVTLDFQRPDGTFVTLFIDFKSVRAAFTNTKNRSFSISPMRYKNHSRNITRVRFRLFKVGDVII